MPRRNRDQEPEDLAVRDGFEMLLDNVKVPVIDEERRGFDDVPRVANERAELRALPYLDTKIADLGHSFEARGEGAEELRLLCVV